jgi:hypothetical protein
MQIIDINDIIIMHRYLILCATLQGHNNRRNQYRGWREPGYQDDLAVHPMGGSLPHPMELGGWNQ